MRVMTTFAKKTRAAKQGARLLGVNIATAAHADFSRALAASRLGTRIAERALVVKDAADIAIWLGAYYYSCNIDW
jgi:hypothetical protein